MNASSVRERYLRLRDEAGPDVTVVVATNYVSLDELALVAEAGVEVVGENRAQDLEEAGCELHEGDVTDRSSLNGAARDCDVAYYLVHLMGRGSGGDFAREESRAAENFARAAADEGVPRVVVFF